MLILTKIVRAMYFMMALFCVFNGCIVFPIYSLTVRLVGGRDSNQGRVEVYYNGEWGTVCSAGWDNTDASVVCRQLGYGVSGKVLPSDDYEKGSGSIFLSNVVCSENDQTLAACGHSGVGIVYGCNHDYDVGVICDGMCHGLDKEEHGYAYIAILR